MTTMTAGTPITYNPSNGCFETLLDIQHEGRTLRVASWVKAPMTADPAVVLRALRRVAMRRLSKGRALVSSRSDAPGAFDLAA